MSAPRKDTARSAEGPPSARPHSMKQVPARLISLAGMLFALLTAWAIGYRAAQLPREPYWGMSPRGPEVALVHPGGPADRAGIRSGDRLLSVDGVPVDSVPGISTWLRQKEPGRSHSIQVQRETRVLTLVLFPERLPGSEILWLAGYAVVALATLLIGVVVFLRRLARQTATFYGICFGLAVLLFRPYVVPTPAGYRFDAIMSELLSVLLPGMFVHFFLLFPYERAWIRRHAVLQWLLYLPGLLLFAGSSLGSSMRQRLGLAGLPLDRWLENGAGIIMLVSLVASAALFAQAYRNARVPTIRRKMKITLAGTLSGLLPLLVVVAVHNLFPGRSVPGDRLATLMVFLLPAGFGYAILRHGIFEIEFIVKRSVFYSSITALLILLYFVCYFGLRLLLHNVTGIGERLGTILAVSFVFLIMSPIREKVQNRLDRWIYPDRYDTQRVLRETGHLLREARGRRAVEHAIVQSARALLGVEQAALLRAEADGESFAVSTTLREDGASDASSRGARGGEPEPPGRKERSAAAAGVNDQGAETTLRDDPAAEIARRNDADAEAPRLSRFLADPLFTIGRPVLRYDLEAELPYGFLPRPDLDTLERLRVQALLPLFSGTHRLGILTLGPRSFGEHYTPPDLESLEGLQLQAALALENAHLAEESAGRAHLQQEMEVARVLQQQLLPREIPRLSSVEIAASNVPCREVGGDYYDFMQVRPSELTVAIGDVSGKGVPAALLMANVQATFRAEISSGHSPHEVCEHMNRRLCTIDRPDRFVSFFCGRLDLDKRELAYANAGHLMPMLIRADGSLERLDRGGLLLGIAENARYEGDRVQLTPGDVLVMFTDGVVERGGCDAVFGEPDLAGIARSHRHLSARDLMGNILEELSRRGGDAADDDTTLLVLKSL